MFKQGLNNPGVTDYDSYAKSLLSSLKSAMEIAKKHSSAKQQHQARQYNRHVKGTYLSVGDRVLVANKTERGKRKLSVWEDGMDTYKMWTESQEFCTGICYLRSTSCHSLGWIRVKLPMLVMLESEESGQEDCDSGDETAMVFGVLPQEDAAQDFSYSRDGAEPTVSSPGVSSESNLADSQELVPSSPVLSPARTIVDSTSTAPAPHVDTSVHIDSHLHSGAESHVRTHAGRMMKSVNRLIEAMTQKPFQKGLNILLGSR